MSEAPFEAARASGLIRPGEPLLVLLSGGGDSVCLLEVALRIAGSGRVSALHVNYGLREGADVDEAFVAELCSRRGAVLRVERVDLGAGSGGNLQARARDARYALAEELAEGDYAAAHTASDQAETVLYRLAVSPGSRALRGMEPRRERLVRPLLGVTRAQVRDYLRERGLDWREDPSNADRRFARARVRHDVLAALRELSPAAELTIAETAGQLRDEGELLELATREALQTLGGGPAISLAALREQPAPLRRLVLRHLAEEAAGGPLSRREADEIVALGDQGTKALDLGGGLRAVAEYGTLRFTRASEPESPAPAELPIPGRTRFGNWEVEARAGRQGEVSLSAVALGASATVRGWREGDRMRPLGLGGSKTLQDLFTDRKVPRALRRTLPVIEVNGEIAWVAGLAAGERFAASEGEGTVGLTARLVS